MPDEAGLFQTKGPTWSERANLGELNAVLSPTGSERANGFLHGTAIFGARLAMRTKPQPYNILDFGCGNGRFLRFFGRKGLCVTGTEVTAAMIDAAKRIGVPENTKLLVTDGIHIPESDDSFDLIWCCGVLRYSLFVETPVYDKIAAEMFRVLRPGGRAVILEMYVDVPPEIFIKDFEMTGFKQHDVRVINRHNRRIERLFSHRFVPTRAMSIAGQISAAVRYFLDSPYRSTTGVRDYFFVWRKPD